jgi:hypothetical protein
VFPLTVGIRDGAVQMVSTAGSVVISARAELGSIIPSALLVATAAGVGAERLRTARCSNAVSTSAAWREENTGTPVKTAEVAHCSCRSSSASPSTSRAAAQLPRAAANAVPS